MSDSEEENFCFFGKPLEPYDEDEFPKKKPITIEDQVATDAQGRRRFHGAFTGGFSAGFFNTVGSLEGWTPQEFKSTRQDKAKSRTQKPEDFMDDEDIGEHGIAPQTVRVTSDYSTSKKRKRMVFADGPVPGEPVLHTLLTSGNETIGYLLLKNIGIQDKIHLQQQELTESSAKVYGCEMPKTTEIPKNVTVKQYEIPQLYKEYLAKPKADTFGLGHEGLDKTHINLFKSSSLVVHDKNNKKLSISGQAFGVGAFEEDDDDIYLKDDMSKYDFELTDEKKSNKSTTKKNLVFDMFVQSKIPLINKKLYPLPTIPHSFSGKHKIKKSRFEPIEENESETVSRHEINPDIRAQYLGEEVNTNATISRPVLPIKIEKDDDDNNKKQDENGASNNRFDLSQVLLSDRFVSASKPEDVRNILETVEREETEHGTQEMRDAVKMKMFGRLTRIIDDWHPNPLLCKRFNVPEPHTDKSESKKKKRTKNLIFEYQKHNEEVNLKPGLSMQVKEEPSTSSNVVQETETTENPVVINNDVQIDNSEVETVKENPEEELPGPKDITEKVNVEENIDLFKEIFLSSSDESEDENESEKQKIEIEKRMEEMKTNVVSDELLPKIKPRKEGILSNVNFMKFNQANQINKFVNEHERDNNESNDDESIYGPKLPQRVALPVNSNKVVNVGANDNEDDWIEKSEINNKKKNKHKKKHKKEKHSKKDKRKSR